MLKDFKAFILRGNVVDLAVGIVVGSAFTALVSSLVKNLLTPLISIPGKENFANLYFKVNGSTFHYGTFFNDMISFLIVATAVFFLVVRPINSLAARRRRGQEPDPGTRPCPECLTDVPALARRCSSCTSPLEPVAAAG